MAPHLTPAEQDIMLKANAMGKTPSEIFEKLGSLRRSKDIEMVNITVARRFLNGKTNKQGIAETRGKAARSPNARKQKRKSGPICVARCDAGL